jgi:hypothetical protein
MLAAVSAAFGIFGRSEVGWLGWAALLGFVGFYLMLLAACERAQAPAPDYRSGIEIAPGPERVYRLEVLGSLALACGGAFALRAAARFRLPHEVWLVGAFGLSFSILATMYMLDLVRKRPAFRIDALGIHVGTPPRLLRWEDIEDIRWRGGRFRLRPKLKIELKAPAGASVSVSMPLILPGPGHMLVARAVDFHREGI